MTTALPSVFVPHPLLRNTHLMTIVPYYLPRRGLSKVRAERRLFRVAPDSWVLGLCHWQKERRDRPTLVVLHGLEGCADSHYMRGLADKAWARGMNVVRLNQRNCGGTEHLTPTLYHLGLSEDLHAVVTELSSLDGLSSLWLAGYSMGGNLVLKLAGEAGLCLEALRGVAAVCPCIDPEQCVEALEHRTNRIYERHFVGSLKTHLRKKARWFPGRFDTSRLAAIRTLRAFDHAYTAPDSGYDSAESYYRGTGAIRNIRYVRVPTLIITAQDDPFVPYQQFDHEDLKANGRIQLIAPRHGGHCGFVQQWRPGEDRYWAEHRVMEYIAKHEGIGVGERHDGPSSRN